MDTNIITVPFHGQSLSAALVNEIPYVALKPICESMGIDWEGQRQRIARHPVLNQVACMIKATCLGEDGKSYLVEMMMLPIKYLNGWLFCVDANRVKPVAKPRVIEYQRECFEVLANHFMPQLPRNDNQSLPEPPTLKCLPNGLSLEQQDMLKAMVKERVEELPKDKQKGAAIRCWSSLKAKFGKTYKEISPSEFTTALSLVARLPLEGELLEKAKPVEPVLVNPLEPDSMLNCLAQSPIEARYDVACGLLKTMTMQQAVEFIGCVFDKSIPTPYLSVFIGVANDRLQQHHAKVSRG